ncbi:MAG TPA: sensor domain-containing diguanylate cyclase [bacterium]|nr:sensor domain-containing diguanylate cyclase [bacterium]
MGRESPADSRRALALVARLATEFTTVLNLPDLLGRVIQLIREETEFDSCGISLIDPRDPDLLVIRAASGLRASAVGQRFPRGQGLGWVAIESGGPLIVPDVLADPRSTRRLDPQPRSGMWVPFVVGTKVIGLVSAFRATPGGFTEAERDLLVVVSRYLAGAMEVARLHEQLKEVASTDALTGLVTRRAFLESLRSELERSRRAGYALSIALVDLDRFKRVNDTYGHAAGDDVLSLVAHRLRAGIRAYDVAGRFGGDEFALLFPQTAPAQAETMLGRLGPDGSAVRGVPGAAIEPVGFSWGIAGCPADGDDEAALLRVADARLYAMKRHRSVDRA